MPGKLYHTSHTIIDKKKKERKKTCHLQPQSYSKVNRRRWVVDDMFVEGMPHCDSIIRDRLPGMNWYISRTKEPNEVIHFTSTSQVTKIYENIIPQLKPQSS